MLGSPEPVKSPARGFLLVRGAVDGISSSPKISGAYAHGNFLLPPGRWPSGPEAEARVRKNIKQFILFAIPFKSPPSQGHKQKTH